MAETEHLVRRVSTVIADGKAVAIHCRAGIGRSSLIAACVLVLNGYDARSSFDTILKARGLGVPDTEVQRDWVFTFQAAACRHRGTRRLPKRVYFFGSSEESVGDY
jgi:protein tyrosine/serine phosphatase